jgi:hypothetical protein
MAFQTHANFVQGTILTPPSPATTGTSITLQQGQGALFPTPTNPYSVVLTPPAPFATAAISEIATVTAIAGDVFTVTRHAESTTAQTVTQGWTMTLAPTAKSFTDIESGGNLTSSAFATNAVAAANLATNAIKLGQAQITSNFTSTNTAFTLITGLSVAVTVPSGGRDVRVSFTGGCSSSAGAGNNWTLDVWDSTNSVEVGGTGIISIPTASFTVPCTFFTDISAPTAGSHTYQIRFSQSASATFTCNAASTMPAQILVEAI